MGTEYETSIDRSLEQTKVLMAAKSHSLAGAALKDLRNTVGSVYFQIGQVWSFTWEEVEDV